MLPVASLLGTLTQQGLRETPALWGQPELPGARLKAASDSREATTLTALAYYFPKVRSVVWGVLSMSLSFLEGQEAEPRKDTEGVHVCLHVCVCMSFSKAQSMRQNYDTPSFLTYSGESSNSMLGK